MKENIKNVSNSSLGLYKCIIKKANDVIAVECSSSSQINDFQIRLKL